MSGVDKNIDETQLLKKMRNLGFNPANIKLS